MLPNRLSNRSPARMSAAIIHPLPGRRRRPGVGGIVRGGGGPNVNGGGVGFGTEGVSLSILGEAIALPLDGQDMIVNLIAVEPATGRISGLCRALPGPPASRGGLLLAQAEEPLQLPGPSRVA